MRPLLYRSLALVAGVAVALATSELAGWHVAAVGTGLLWTLSVLVVGRTNAAFESRDGAPSRRRLGQWGGVYGGLVGFAAAMLTGTRSLPTGEEVALALVVFGAGAAGLAAGMGMALTYLDAAGDRSTPDRERHPS